jgi:hypothetical protein
VENYPANSQRPTRVTKVTDPTEKADEKKIERVTEGEVIRRKKPLGKRFMETFIGGDAKGVAGYIMMDVLLPAAKDTIADAVSQAIERMLFGEVRSSSRRTGARPGGGSGYTSYNRFSNTPANRREEPRGMSRQARAKHDFDEIILATRHEAEEVIDRLFDLVARYDQATVSDLYDLLGLSAQYTDEKWGWSDIRGIGIVRVRSGYLLDIPKPEPLD